MPAIEISEDTYQRLQEFRGVVNAVMDEELETQACADLILQQGLDSMLQDILGPQDQAILLRSFRQLAARDPAVVYRYVAEVIKTGTKVHERETKRPRMGFSIPEPGAGSEP